ncbi:MAG: hypothetical protein GF408_01235 [Candidatus Omnitrophica bacterium]|nr:hypothetical protein [Candidatus Omnitrophota bacterium]
MRKKKYSQSCEVSALGSRARRTRGRKGGSFGKKPSQKEVSAVFRKFYKKQVEALYRAVIDE